MINLLPPQTKQQIRAARTNVMLYKYCVLIFGTALLLGAIFAVGFWADMSERRFADEEKAQSVTATAPYADTREAAEEFSKNLATAKTILANNVSFSTLLLDIAANIPQGVVLNNLALGTSAKPDAPIDISGQAVSYQAAIALKNSLEASKIFENVNIVNVSQADLSTASDTLKKYPFTVSVKAQFTKGGTTQ